MAKLSMCRICFVENVRMYVVVNKSLQELYEKLTGVPFVTEDNRPMLACYFCCTKLKQCWQFQRKCLEAEELFAQMLNEDYKLNHLRNRGQSQFFSGYIKTPIVHVGVDNNVDKVEKVVIKQELSVEFERQDDVIQLKVEPLSDDEREQQGSNNSDANDIPRHCSGTGLQDVPTEGHTDVGEEQEVSEKKRKVENVTRAPVSVAKKPRIDMDKESIASRYNYTRSKVQWTAALESYPDLSKLFSEDLINLLEMDLAPYMSTRVRSSGITKRQKILCALSFLVNGGYQRIVGRNANTYLSQPSASRAIQEVVDALNNKNIIHKYIRFPQNRDDRQALKCRFFEKFKIPGVLGCVDATLVSMIRPTQNEERYYCRKGYHTRNVLIINDADLNILHVDVTFGGATQDSFIFANTKVKEHLERLNNNGEVGYLLGDSGYPQTPYLMTPFTDPEADTAESNYNTLHKNAWKTTQRTVETLKGRFRCLLVHRVLHYDPITVGKIVIACCVLHNICNKAGFPAPSLEQFDLNEESRLLGILMPQPTSQDDLESGQISRRYLANQLWRARNI